MLAFARTTTNQLAKVVALTGYFFSLRPQEIFPLIKSDFRAGKSVMMLESSKALKRVGLFDRMPVNIMRQKTNRAKIVEPKSGSGGWDYCFKEETARMLIEILKALKDDDPLLKVNNRSAFKRWESEGIDGITIKDLRRSSLYWLGHSTSIQPMELMKHARHNQIDTTMLYLRRPEETVE